jgi:3-oxoacyl-[acyl-carrier-protein] synthase II
LLDTRAVDSTRLGIILGVGMLNADVFELGRAVYASNAVSGADRFQMDDFGRHGVPQLSPLWLLRHIPNLAAAHASILLEAQGVSNTIATGCVAAANAIGEAARTIARGAADVVLAGGTDARVSPFAMLRYRELGWLATREDVDPAQVSAPFDESAAGFVNGEAAGVLVLESLEHASARGAPIRAELVGYGAGNDAHDFLTPHPGGRGLVRATSKCVAGIGRNEVGAVFSPAPSIPAFDDAVAAALAQSFSGIETPPSITATRSILGHTHAASAALDAIAAVQALAHSQIPAIRNLKRPTANLPFVTSTARMAIETALVGAYGFGGHAAALAFRRYSA